MPKVNLFVDFQGVETKNVFYPKGVHNLPDDIAERLVKDGRAEYVKTDVRDVEPQFENAYDPDPQPVKEEPAPETFVMSSLPRAEKSKRGGKK